MNEETSLNANNDKEILDKIFDIILKYCPVVDDRMKSIHDNRINPCMSIEFIFVKENNKDKTYMNFMYGNNYRISSVPEDLEIDGIVSDNIVFSFINKLLLDHEVIRNFDVSDTGIKLDFAINYREDNLKGINCENISVEFDFYHYNYPNKELLMENYINKFALNYLDKLKNTTYFSNKIERYFSHIKEEFIDSLDYNSLRKFICLMSDGELKDIIRNMSDNRFKQLQEKYDDSDKVLKLNLK